MDNDGKRWLIRNSKGRIRGPISTSEILAEISEGFLVGDEEIALFPGSHWHPIAQTPEFYDRLLNLISGEEPEEVEYPNSGSIDLSGIEVSETTQSPQLELDGITDSDQQTNSKTSSRSKTKGSSKDKSRNKDRAKRSEKSRRSKSSSHSDVIDLHKMEKVVGREVAKRAKFPILVAIVVIAVAAVLLMPEGQDSSSFKLIAPGKAGSPMSADEVKTRYKRALAHFYRDNFSNYIKTQNDLVQIIEGSPRFYQAQALLCRTYFELWPFTRQDSKDLAAIKKVARLSSGSDKNKPYASVCRYVDLMASSLFTDAAQLVDRSLNRYGNQQSPPVEFYYFKGLLLKQARDFPTALGYANSAVRIRPQWIRLHAMEARLYQAVNEHAKSAVKYRQIIKSNSSHANSKIELGLLEYRKYRHYDKARELLVAGIKEKKQANRSVLTMGYLGLAEIYLHRNEKNKALKYAQLSYGLNPSDNISKNLVIRLGGIEKLKKTVVKEQQLVIEGDQFVREGDCNAAQAHYKSAFKLNKKNAVAAMKAAKCLWEMSLSQEAVEWLNKAIKADPKLIEAYVTLADYHTKRFNFMAAARVLGKAQAIAPRSPEVYRGFAMVELQRNNPGGSITFALRALKLYDQDVDSHILLSKAYLLLQKYRESYSHASKALELDMNSSKAQVVYAKAIAGIQGIDMGVAYIADLVERYPHVIEYRKTYGEILVADERYAEAELIYRQIVDIEESPKDALVNLGRVLTALSKYEEALDVYLRAAVIDPSDSEPVFEAGLLYLSVKKPAMARKQFRRVLRVNERYPLVHYYIGLSALRMGNTKEALNQAQLERQINPNLADSYLLAADAYTKMGEFTLCAREYQKAIKLRSQGAQIYVKVAHCYRKSGNLDVASSMLTQAISIESGLADIYREQGLIYETRGQRMHAIASYQKYLTLQPNAGDRALIERKIATLSGG